MTAGSAMRLRQTARKTAARMRPILAAAPVNVSTNTGVVAADLLQEQLAVTIGSIHDCRLGNTTGAALDNAGRA